MTSTVSLNAQLRQQILETNQEQVQAIIDTAQSGAVSTANQFVFFAAFDGTNNDLENAGNVQNTNVAQLWEQFKAKIGTNSLNVGGQYYPARGPREHSRNPHGSARR